MGRRLITSFIAFAMVLLSVPLGSAPANAAGAINFTGATYAQNFDTLASTGTSSVTPEGWAFAESGTNANTLYTAGTGSGNSGDTYSFGASSNAERAFGGLQSGSLIPTIGAQFINNTGATITRLGIAYTGEQWRLGTSGRGPDRLDFQYSLDATSLTTGSWTNADALDFSGPISVGTVGPLDGNAPQNRVAVAATIEGLTIADGALFWIRWTDLNASGADDGLAIDEFSINLGDEAPFVAATVPADGAVAVSPSADVNVTFSEPVTVDPSTFSMTCATSGNHALSLSGGPVTFTLDPSTNFASDEACAVIVVGAGVTDVDTNDPPDHMSGDYAFSFTTISLPRLAISQVYGGGGNSGATLTNDFIELFNRGTTSVDLTGWSVQYASAAGTTWQVTTLSGAIFPGGYYLIQEAPGAGGTQPLPPPNVTGTIAMSATSAKVALVSSTTPLSGGCPTGPAIADLVGYGSTATCFEGSGPTPTLSNTTAALRAGGGCIDTNNNASDFAAGGPAPRNSATPFNDCRDAAPAIASTSPANAATGIAVNASVSITFTEPVVVTGAWYSINCATSGNHTATVSGGPTTFTIDPDSNFANSESCTVSVSGALVSDADTIDPPDTVVGNPSFAFTTIEENFSCTDPRTAIHTVQGSGLASPLNGANVTIQGVVVGDYQASGQFGGYYLEEMPSDWDADPATSEGIFVFSSLVVSPGDFVRVAGTVTESFSLTELMNVTRAVICSTGNAVPPVTITLPVATYTEFERYEGMLVRFDQTLTATETFTLARFGEVRLAANGRLYTPTAVTTPGSAAIAREDENQRRSFVLDDGNNQQNIDPTLYPTGGLSASNTLRSGYTTTGLTGVFDYRFNTYRVQPVGPVSFTSANQRTQTPDPVGGNTRIASFNVLNYFNGDGQGGGFPTSRGATTFNEFQRQTAKEVSALIALNPDIAGLMEIENDAGTTSALAQLVASLNNSAGAGTYAYIDTGVIGTDEIKVALIYKPAVVTPVGQWRVITSATDPRFIDTRNRPSLAQTFLRNGTAEKFTVVVNHLKSKGSSCADIGDPDTGDGQGNCNVTRTQAAAAIVDWLATDPTGSASPNFLLIGDMNSYTFEDPITTFTNGGLLNLVREFDGLSAYSYVFSGESGYLDHALASPRLAANVTGVTHWHINADEPVALDYNVEFKSPNQVNTFYAPNAYRSSDHDPVVIGLGLHTAQLTFTSTPADVTVFTGAGATACGVFISDATLGMPTATGGVPPVTISRSVVPTGNVFPVGKTTITYTATDSLGATATATQTVTVIDNTPPSITAPAPLTRGTGPGATGATVFISDSDLGLASANDNCSGVTISRSALPTGNLFSVGETTIVYTATDAAGNTASATQTITVIDNTPPHISAPADVNAATGPGASSCGVFISDATLGLATASDNAGAVSIQRSALPTGNLFPVGTTVITYTAFDQSGNSASATQRVTVIDNTSPLITAPANASYQVTSQVPVGHASDATATDNCGFVSVSLSETNNGGAGTPASPLVITRTYTATDASGNSASATQTITVIDSIAPTITAPANVTAFTGTGATACGTVVTDATLGTATATDNSGFTTITRSGAPAGNIFPVGATTITYTATDAAGNSASATQRVTVIDNTPPTISAPANITRDATGVLTLITDAELGTATASDNCSGITIARTGVPAGNLFPHGTTTITYTATDASGNAASATQTVTVNATTTSVCATVRSYIASAGIANSLCVKLDAAAAARARGNVNAHDNVLDAFLKEVNAQRGKALTEVQADALISLAGAI